MENLLFLLLLPLLHLLQLSSLSLLSSAYTLPDKYFINCGSDSNVTINGRNFIGDEKPNSFSLSSSRSSIFTNTNSTEKDTSPLYQTARIFTKPSSYELEIAQNGTYMVRFHFYPFPSPKNLFSAQFNVSASGFSLLSDFSVEKTTNPPLIEEFLVTINMGKFEIHFLPSQDSSFAFANAIEVFLAPDNFITDNAPHVTPRGSNNSYYGLLSHVLHPVHRVNVGGLTLTPANDTLWRNWVPDDDFLLFRDAAKNVSMYGDRPKYQAGGATEYFAPDLVYLTAKELNINTKSASNYFNITWCFNASRNAPHLVRVHFCDIISKVIDVRKFNLYVFNEFSKEINPYDVGPELAAPFYHDFFVDSDGSGFINISVGPQSNNQTAFLNGVEIMEILVLGPDLVPDLKKPSRKHLFVIVGSVVGGVAFLFTLMVVFLLSMKLRKKRPVENLALQENPFYGGGSSFGRSSENAAQIGPPLYFGLKFSFVDIQLATNNFDMRLMIGGGGFGKVYKGTLRNGLKVAVKRSEPGHGQGLPEFQTEIMVLSKIRHHHLVSLIGYCDEKSEMILVYEFMEKGTLRDHLYNLKQDFGKLSWIRRLEICIGASKGLNYLHTSLERGIIHRDVKSTNILLDENYVAKVADFGISRLGALDQTHVSTGVKGSFGYLDPEYFRSLQLTQKSDVYSFGVVLLEVLCARPAINTLLPREEINLAEWGLSWLRKGQLEKIVDPFLVGKINANSLRMFGEIVEKCLRESGVERPSMHDVLWDLNYALQLQQTARQREPHEDSTTDADASWVLPVPNVDRLPSHSVLMDECEVPLADFSNPSHSSASEVFSQLRMDEAR